MLLDASKFVFLFFLVYRCLACHPLASTGTLKSDDQRHSPNYTKQRKDG